MDGEADGTETKLGNYVPFCEQNVLGTTRIFHNFITFFETAQKMQVWKPFEVPEHCSYSTVANSVEWAGKQTWPSVLR